jgi:hypothetical protein
MRLLKFICLALLFIFIQPNFAIAQDGMIEEDTRIELTMNSDSTKTLFSNVKFKSLGLYVAPEAGFSQFANAYARVGGASAMLLINGKFAIGVSGQSTDRNSFTPTDLNANSALAMRVQNAGLKVEYIASIHKVVHLTFPLTIGVGRASVDSVNGVSSPINIIDFDDDRRNGRGSRGRGNDANSSNFGFIQPGVNLELNVFKYGKIFIGGSYRIATNINSNAVAPYTLTTAQVSGLNINVGAKLGLFTYNISKK